MTRAQLTLFLSTELTYSTWSGCGEAEIEKKDENSRCATPPLLQRMVQPCKLVQESAAGSTGRSRLIIELLWQWQKFKVKIEHSHWSVLWFMIHPRNGSLFPVTFWKRFCANKKTEWNTVYREDLELLVSHIVWFMNFTRRRSCSCFPSDA